MRIIQRSVVSIAALVLAACDPKAPVESSGGTSADLDAAIAAHAADASTHTNLQVAAANVVGSFGSAQIQDGAITADKIANDSIDSDHIFDGSIGTNDLAGGAVGQQQLANGAVAAQHLAVNAVQTASIGDLMVTGAKIAADAISTAKILDGQVGAGDLGADAVTTGKILDGEVQNGDLGADAVTSAKIMDGQVANGDLGADAVTSGKIMDGEVMNADLDADAVTTAKIMDGQVQTDDIANANVTTAKIADAGVTVAKLFTTENGRGAATAFTDVQVFQTNNAPPANVTVTLACGAEAGTAGEMRIVEGANLVAGPVACPANSAANPLLLRMTFAPANNKNYELEYRAGAAASAVVWRFLNIVSL